MLKGKKCDFALIDFSDNIVNHSINYNISKITEGSFYFAVNNKSKLSSKEVITFDDIIHERLAIYDDKFLINLISNVESKTGKEAKILFKTNNFISIVNSVEENIAISFGPSYVIVNDFYGKLNNIKTIPMVQDEDVLIPSLWFLSIKNKSLEEIGEEFLNSIKENIKLIK